MYSVLITNSNRVSKESKETSQVIPRVQTVKKSELRPRNAVDLRSSQSTMTMMRLNFDDIFRMDRASYFNRSKQSRPNEKVTHQ